MPDASRGSRGIDRDNRIWGGAVIFERDGISEAAFLDELRRTASDGYQKDMTVQHPQNPFSIDKEDLCGDNTLSVVVDYIL